MLILADYDAIDRQLGNPRLADGTPLPQGEFRKLACDAEILTGIFDADLRPPWQQPPEPPPRR